MNFTDFFTFSSLRSRVVGIATLLAVLIISAVWFAQLFVSNASKARSVGLEERNTSSQLNRQIRDDMWEVEYALQLYMLSPSVDLQKTVQKKLRHAITTSNELQQMQWIKLTYFDDQVKQLGKHLNNVSHKINRLMEVRQDAELMYPGLKIARNKLLPRYDQFMSAVSVAIEELREDNEEGNHELQVLFYETQKSWQQMISVFRMSLVARFAALITGGTKQLEDTVEIHYQRIKSLIGKLKQAQEADRLGLQAADSVIAMEKISEQWLMAYHKLQNIHNIKFWRSDVPIMKDVIQPILVEIQSLLKGIDTHMEETAVNDVSMLADVSDTLIKTLWALGLVFLLFIGLSYISFERRLLSPIEKVAKGLRDEASGNQPAQLPPASITEIQYLTDAFHEMQQQVHMRQDELEHQAMHDALTQLPNRTLLHDRMRHDIETARRNDTPLSLIMIDLNRFKEINDTLGHHTGDKLLQMIGSRLSSILRASDTVARLGGDEFAILLPNMASDDVMHSATKIIREIEKVYDVEKKSLYIGASLGIASFPEHGDTADILMQHADVAMYIAKRTNTGISLYDYDKDEHSISNLSLTSDLRSAIDDNSLYLKYQPQYSLKTRSITGVEALLRWDHPGRGPVPPEAIIPIAEQSGMIKQLSIWVLNRSLQQLKQWQENGINLSLAVNMSTWDLVNPELVDKLKQLLNFWNIHPDLLTLEITESGIMSDPKKVLDILKQLSDMGISIAIDDYGTGFSSLAYLKKLPVSYIKIDKSFVINMAEDDNNAVIVRSAIDMAHNLGFIVVAEGVETETSLKLLDILGCDVVQGYYMSRPLAASDIGGLTGSRNTILRVI